MTARTHWVPITLLLAIVAIWGWTFVVVKDAVAAMTTVDLWQRRAIPG